MKKKRHDKINHLSDYHKLEEKHERFHVNVASRLSQEADYKNYAMTCMRVFFFWQIECVYDIHFTRDVFLRLTVLLLCYEASPSIPRERHV